MSENLKQCPYCGENILAVAIKCKHCNSNLDSDIRKTEDHVIDNGIYLLAIPIIGIMLVWFWVSSMNLLQSPSSTMSLILLFTILGTAITASIEVSKSKKMVANKKNGMYSATTWFFLITLLWVFYYPIYLYKRKNIGLPKKLISGILISIIFTLSWIIMSVAIETKKTELIDGLDKMKQEINSLGG